MQHMNKRNCLYHHSELLGGGKNTSVYVETPSIYLVFFYYCRYVSRAFWLFSEIWVCGLSDIHRKCVFRYQLHLLCYGDASSFKVGWLVNTYARPPPFPHLNQFCPVQFTLKVTNTPQEALTFKGNEPIQKANLTCYTLLHFSGLHVSPCFHAKKRKNANSIHSMVSNKEEREKDLQIAQILDQPDHKGC